MNVAAVDVGTNTVLLLIASMDNAGTISRLVEEQRIPRLGEGVDQQRALHAAAMERVVRVLREYAEMIQRYTPVAVVVCATSAVRDASNREEFVSLVRRETGLEMEILSGEEEALWTYRGAISSLPGIGDATVVDVGGGSTEISAGAGKLITRSLSLDIGSVRLSERFFKHDPPLPGEIGNATACILEQIAPLPAAGDSRTPLVAVAGTATSLALLAQNRRTFSFEAVSGARLTLVQVDHLFRMLCSLPASKIRQLSEVMEGRSDIITAGALILKEIMTRCGFREMIVSERGVRYGLALREWERRQVN